MLAGMNPEKETPVFHTGQQVVLLETGDVWTVTASTLVDKVLLYDIYQPGLLKTWVAASSLKATEPSEGAPATVSRKPDGVATRRL